MRRAPTTRMPGLPPVPTHEEEKAWFAELGDPSTPPARRKELRDRLVGGNMGIVWLVVLKSKTHERYHEHLASHLTVVLIQCVDKFDPGEGVRFGSYAAACMRGQAVNYTRLYETLIHVPHWVASPGRANPPPKKYLRAAKKAFRAAPDSDLGWDDGAEFRRGLAAEASGVDDADELAAVAAAVESLPARERDVIRSRYAPGDKLRTYPEIGLELGVTREHASKIHGRALARLRERLGVGTHPAPAETTRHRKVAPWTT